MRPRVSPLSIARLCQLESFSVEFWVFPKQRCSMRVMKGRPTQPPRTCRDLCRHGWYIGVQLHGVVFAPAYPFRDHRVAVAFEQVDVSMPHLHSRMIAPGDLLSGRITRTGGCNRHEHIDDLHGFDTLFAQSSIIQYAGTLFKISIRKERIHYVCLRQRIQSENAVEESIHCI